ncbi:MAG: hypothetical protein HUU56_11865 [Bdellovibrionaceae bacterium]|nr:hypothetical protein [Pseudobdellovibrionaceae bacterium]
MSVYYITTFYHFFPLKAQGKEAEQVKEELKKLAVEFSIHGLIITGSEGFNATISAMSSENLQAFKEALMKHFHIQIKTFKDSTSHIKPFRRFSVKIREEIVTTGIPGRVPEEFKNFHLSPEEWDQVIKKENDYVMIDTRNWYEYKLGTFRGALNPNIEKFTDFPEYFEKQNIPKDKKIMIFCTGGIRCEKGILELQDKGYEKVYQLDGGILNYLKEKPNEEFLGECFVFDNRVAVDQNLNPSQKYKLCPHCGQPGEIKIHCKRCDSEALLCESCLQLDWKKDTCSKNCAYQYSQNPLKKGKKQERPSV